MTKNSTDKQPQNKDSLTKGYKAEIGKIHERYNDGKPVSVFTIDEIIALSQFKRWGSDPRKTKDKKSNRIMAAPLQNL